MLTETDKLASFAHTCWPRGTSAVGSTAYWFGSATRLVAVTPLHDCRADGARASRALGSAFFVFARTQNVHTIAAVGSV